MSLCRLEGCKVVVCQALWMIPSPGLKPGLYAFGSTLAEQKDFFQISDFDSLQLCSPLTYRDPQYLCRNIKLSSIDIVSN